MLIQIADRAGSPLRGGLEAFGRVAVGRAAEALPRRNGRAAPGAAETENMMNRSKRYATLALAATLTAGLGSTARAASVDSFDYPSKPTGTDINGFTGGSGWDTDAWTKDTGSGTFVYRNTAGLTYSTLVTAGGATREESSTRGAGYSRNTSLTALGDGGTRWFSFLINADAFTADKLGKQGYVGLNVGALPPTPPATTNASNNGNIAGVGFADFSATNGTYAIRAKGRGDAFSTETLTLLVARTYLIVGRIDATATSTDTVSVYLNPIVGGAAPTGVPLVYTGNLTTNPNFRQFDALTTDPFVGTFDEVRVGSTFAEVTPVAAVPEPASVTAVAAMGLLGLTRRPRRACGVASA